MLSSPAGSPRTPAPTIFLTRLKISLGTDALCPLLAGTIFPLAAGSVLLTLGFPPSTADSDLLTIEVLPPRESVKCRSAADPITWDWMEADAVPLRAKAATNIVTRETMIFSIVPNQSTDEQVVDGNTIKGFWWYCLRLMGLMVGGRSVGFSRRSSHLRQALSTREAVLKSLWQQSKKVFAFDHFCWILIGSSWCKPVLVVPTVRRTDRNVGFCRLLKLT